ncbi:MAG TPA: hypothetical protein ACFYD6_05105 [Candidatus Brocadiia bacterium]|nr:hypothetical protein [Candidatus Brocadiales bacterium]
MAKASIAYWTFAYLSISVLMMNKLAEQNLADKEPNRIIEILFYDHPPISKRIALAEKT